MSSRSNTPCLLMAQLNATRLVHCSDRAFKLVFPFAVPFVCSLSLRSLRLRFLCSSLFLFCPVLCWFGLCLLACPVFFFSVFSLVPLVCLLVCVFVRRTCARHIHVPARRFEWSCILCSSCTCPFFYVFDISLN